MAATASAPEIRNRRLRLMGATGSPCGPPSRRTLTGAADTGARSATASRRRRARRPARSARRHRRETCRRANPFRARNVRAARARVGGRSPRRASRYGIRGGSRARRCARGRSAAEAAGGTGDLLGKAARGVLDRDDVRRAQDPEQQRTAVGMVQPTGGQRRRCRRVERESQPFPGYVRRGYGELMKRHRRWS